LDGTGTLCAPAATEKPVEAESATTSNNLAIIARPFISGFRATLMKGVVESHCDRAIPPHLNLRLPLLAQWEPLFGRQ
jgi:hypothetical protein